MPYYIYQVTELGPVKNLKKLAEFDVFKEASAEAKRLRKESDSPAQIKVMFGQNMLEAEDLLSQVREVPPSIGEDY